MKEGLLIFAGAFLLIMAFFYFSRDTGMETFLLIASFNATMWLVMWKGNEIIVEVIDRRISWLRYPGRRLTVGLAAMLIYVLAASAVITLLFFAISGGFSDWGRIYNSIVESVRISVGITIVVMLIIYSYSFFKSWRQAAINVERLKRESIHSKYEALKNQVNPHFLFNTLNALSSMIYEDPDRAVRFLNRFSDVYRYVLDSREKEVVPLQQEMDFVRSYIFLLQARYEENLHVGVTGDFDTGYVAPMAVQLLVENAVKHNVVSDEHPLTIRIDRKDDRLTVENSVTLKKAGGGKNGMGLDNIRSRYRILSNREVVIEGGDRTFRVTLPVLEMENV